MKENIISGRDAAGSHTLQVISKANRFNKWMYDVFRKQLKGEVLEIGSGIGNISRLVLEDDLSLTLSDYNPEYFEWLKKEFSFAKNIKEIIQINLLHKNFQTEYSRFKENYDSIFLVNVIEHLEDDAKALENCRFILKPGGNLVVLAPAYQWLFCNFDKKLGHFRRYTLDSLSEVIRKNDLTITKKQYFNFAGIAGWLLFGKMLNHKLISKGEMNTFNRFVPLAKWIDKFIANKAGLSIILTAQKQ
jgi:SAM-dependent methyltransferase